MPNKKSIGVTLFSAGLILSSLYKMIILLNFPHYIYLHQELCRQCIIFRYLVSWIEKILILASGIGILYQKDIFRRMAIALWLIIICTISLKHPYAGFLNHIVYLDHAGVINLKFFESHGIPLPVLHQTVVILARLQDVTFGLCLIYFFTRPSVKSQFD